MQDITNRILRQMNSTRLISTLFKPRQKATALYATQAEVLQHKVFCRLMKDAAHTEWGLKYGYKDIKRYQDFQRVPIQTYEEIKPYVERMRHGEKDVLWRGEVQWFAKSSGTTNDKSKLFLSAGRDFMIFIMRVVWMQWRCISNKILRVVFLWKRSDSWRKPCTKL